MCDRDVCFSCFFADLGRCQRCVEQHPEEIADPLPFEARGMIRGFFPTIATALSPRLSAPAFAIGDSLARPAIFFLLTFVPFALLRGVIPFTHRLHFGPLGRLTVVPGSSTRAIVVDVIRASGLSLLEVSAQLIALSVCYVSLASAFGREGSRTIALRTVMYRAFLLPLGGVYGILAAVAIWLGPTPSGAIDAATAIGALPLLPFYLSLHRSVRSVARVDLVPGLFVVMVPWVLATIVGDFTLRAMMPFLPTPAAP